MTGALVISRLATQNLPTLQHVLSIGRGGATFLAAQVASDAVVRRITSVSGGASARAATTQSRVRLLGISMTPEAKAAFFTAVAMACHYWGYSIARPVTVSLFTSASTGYKGFSWAFPFAMAFVSPVSLVLLMGYSRVLERLGPRGAISVSTFFCAIVMTISAIGLGISEETGCSIAGLPVSKLISGPLFIFREAYVQLLSSQFWSFLASILTPNQSAKWFGPIAGLTSIASAAGGVCVLPLVNRIGLAGATLATAVTLLMSMFFSTLAYKTSDKYGFTPTERKASTRLAASAGRRAFGSKSSERGKHKGSMFVKALHLFARVPVLGALFMEILASQGLATVLNVIFVSRLESAIPNDSERAGYVGMFFSLVNIITMVIQIVILPPIMTILEPKDLWRVVPFITMIFTFFQSTLKHPSLAIVSASLLIMKVSEYSVRRMLDEMVFVPLDFESRFLGKEVIGVFGYRFGKSLMSLGISAIAQIAGSGNFGLQQKSYLGAIISVAWMQTAWRLSNLVPTRAEAEETYKKEKLKK
ncbi:hypothetical protein MPSEU_000375800 [Mayamaea pseudoterrestris]|nr:hypothetical protein MPSEU_000375800 [Mayamaea pseudoterrestris]